MNQEGNSGEALPDHASEYESANEANKSESLASTSRNFSTQEDTATSPSKTAPHWSLQQPRDQQTPRGLTLSPNDVTSTVPTLSLPPDDGDDPEDYHPTGDLPNISISPVAAVKGGDRALGASLFSIPPSDAGAHGGVYAMPLEAFEFRDLDSGRTFHPDKRYWIKDVDTGKVYVIEPEDDAEKEEKEKERGPTTTSGASSPSPSPSRTGTERSASLRVSDLISGQQLTLEEFEEALGYSKEAPPPPPPSDTHHLSTSLEQTTTTIPPSDQDFASHAQHIAQRGMHSLSAAAHASAVWFKHTATAAKEKLGPSTSTSTTTTTTGGANTSNNAAHHPHHHYFGGGGGVASPGDMSPTSASSSRAADGQGLPVKVNVSKKPFKELTDLRHVQTVSAHQGVVWTMRFSKSGRYLATAGQDGVVAVWEVISHREKEKSGFTGGGGGAHGGGGGGAANGGEGESGGGGGGITSSETSTTASPRGSFKSGTEYDGSFRGGQAPFSAPSSPGPGSVGGGGAASVASGGGGGGGGGGDDEEGEGSTVFGVPVLRARPVRVYRGHKQDILDVAWSKTNFLLSASMDKTVRLWHVSMDECLRVFKHTDFVTAIDFHPTDDKLFVSGSIDGKVRLWNVPEQRVASWQDVHDMVTAVGYSRDGRRAVVGTMRGKCRFYSVSGKGILEYEAQLDVKNKRGQHARGKKVTGLHFMPGNDPNALLITSNDSRVRLYEGYTLRSKYKGHSNKSTQIKASFSPKGDYVICGSDDGSAYMWSTKKAAVPGSPEKAQPPPAVSPRGGGASGSGGGGSGVAAAGKVGEGGDEKDGTALIAKEKNASYESFQVANDVITVALFGPDCTHRPLDNFTPTADASTAFAAAAASGSGSAPTATAARGQVILTSGYSGEIKIYENIGLPQWLS